MFHIFVTMMSVLFAILALVATVQCAHYDGGLVNTGRSDQYRDEDVIDVLLVSS